MGRNYIAERTWADPRERAAQKALKNERIRKKRAAESREAAAAQRRDAVCWVKGCDKRTVPGWMGCCGEPCYHTMLKELDRRDEVKQARRQGIPVAEYRKQMKGR